MENENIQKVVNVNEKAEDNKKPKKKKKGSGRTVLAVILFTISAVSLGFGLYNLNIYRSADAHNYQVSQNITVAPVPDEPVQVEDEDVPETEEKVVPVPHHSNAFANRPALAVRAVTPSYT